MLVVGVGGGCWWWVLVVGVGGGCWCSILPQSMLFVC